jgi:hypothetical protein
MDVNLFTGMLFENARGLLFFCRRPCAYPQQQAAMIHLLLQVMGMVFANPLGQN